MKLGIQVGLSPGHIVLDGDQAPLPQKGAEPPIFGPYLLWPNGWMDQDAKFGRGPPPQKGSRAPQFLAHVYCGQTAAWIKMPLGMEVGFGPGHIVLDEDPALSLIHI